MTLNHKVYTILLLSFQPNNDNVALAVKIIAKEGRTFATIILSIPRDLDIIFIIIINRDNGKAFKTREIIVKPAPELIYDIKVVFRDSSSP